MTTGLQTHIWNNNLKSIGLLAAYPFIIMALVWSCAYIVGLQDVPSSGHLSELGEALFNNPSANFANLIIYNFWPAILTGVIIWFVIAYLFHTSMIRKLSHANPVTRSDEPDLYNLLETLCISQGMVTPTLNIIESHARNAFALIPA